MPSAIPGVDVELGLGEGAVETDAENYETVAAGVKDQQEPQADRAHTESWNEPPDQWFEQQAAEQLRRRRGREEQVLRDENQSSTTGDSAESMNTGMHKDDRDLFSMDGMRRCLEWLHRNKKILSATVMLIIWAITPYIILHRRASVSHRICQEAYSLYAANQSSSSSAAELLASFREVVSERIATLSVSQQAGVDAGLDWLGEVLSKREGQQAMTEMERENAAAEARKLFRRLRDAEVFDWLEALAEGKGAAGKSPPEKSLCVEVALLLVSRIQTAVLRGAE